MLATKHRVPAAACPYCNQVWTGASNIAGASEPPRAGDATLCIECGLPAIFTDDGALRVPTPDEARELGQDLRVMLAGKVIRSMRREQ